MGFQGSSSVRRIITGTVSSGDVAGTTGALAVSGGIISASAVTPGANQQRISIVYATIAFNNPVVTFSLESFANENNDNDLEAPILKNLTGTGFEIFLHETNSVVQNLKIHITITEGN